jgi:hypothetical protein
MEMKKQVRFRDRVQEEYYYSDSSFKMLNNNKERIVVKENEMCRTVSKNERYHYYRCGQEAQQKKQFLKHDGPIRDIKTVPPLPDRWDACVSPSSPSSKKQLRKPFKLSEGLRQLLRVELQEDNNNNNNNNILKSISFPSIPFRKKSVESINTTVVVVPIIHVAANDNPSLSVVQSRSSSWSSSHHHRHHCPNDDTPPVIPVRKPFLTLTSSALFQATLLLNKNKNKRKR